MIRFIIEGWVDTKGTTGRGDQLAHMQQAHCTVEHWLSRVLGGVNEVKTLRLQVVGARGCVIVSAPRRRNSLCKTAASPQCIRHRRCRGVYYLDESISATAAERPLAVDSNQRCVATCGGVENMGYLLRYTSCVVQLMLCIPTGGCAFLADLTLSTTAATRLPPGQSRPGASSLLANARCAFAYHVIVNSQSRSPTQ